MTLPAGDKLLVPVRFEPTTSGSFTATLSIETSSLTTPSISVPLSGTSQANCLLVAPSDMDFGVVQSNCNSRGRTFSVYNVCSSAQTLTSIELQPGPSTEFQRVWIPLLPFSLAAGGSTDFKVKYSPTDLGEDDASLAVSSSSGPPVVVGLHGRGDLTAIQTDVFGVAPQPKIDVLFVVDDSASMADKQASLAASFASFTQIAATAQADYRIAVTTTSVDVAHGGTYTGGGEANGCFFAAPGNPAVITPQTPNVSSVFASNVRVGTDGNPDEMLLRPLYLALSQPNLGGCTAGFLRDDAALSVVIVSDTFDDDSTPVSFYANFLLALKGLARHNSVTVSGLVPVNPASCFLDVATQNGRADQLIAMFGGLREDICATDWAPAMERIGQAAFGMRTRYFLSSVPDLAAQGIAVEVDGVPYSQVGPVGDVRWTFDSATNALDFDPLAAPEPGSTITVSYHVACL
ncbi:MAG: choice-of-anchor D domain-containing protein [Myxococcales bacterium]